MKCEENEGDSPQKRPSSEPSSRSTSPEAAPGSSKPAPGPSKPAPAPPKHLPASQGDSPHPTPAPRKKPAAKRKTAPAPATSERKPVKRRKTVKTQDHIESDEDDDDNLSERSRLPIMRRVGEIETYCGNVSLLYIYISHFYIIYLDVRITRLEQRITTWSAITGTMADSMDRYSTNEDEIMDAAKEVPAMKEMIAYLQQALELTEKQVEGLKTTVIKQNKAIEKLILLTESLAKRKSEF
jgi:hypothetical protein